MVGHRMEAVMKAVGIVMLREAGRTIRRFAPRPGKRGVGHRVEVIIQTDTCLPRNLAEPAIGGRRYRGPRLQGITISLPNHARASWHMLRTRLLDKQCAIRDHKLHPNAASRSVSQPHQIDWSPTATWDIPISSRSLYT